MNDFILPDTFIIGFYGEKLEKMDRLNVFPVSQRLEAFGSGPSREEDFRPGLSGKTSIFNNPIIFRHVSAD
jgi:hypothetical protein